MSGFNYEVTAAPFTAYADAGVTAGKDYNVQNLGGGVVEYTTAASQPATDFRGLQMGGGVIHPVLVPAGEKLWARLAPGARVTSAVITGIGVT